MNKNLENALASAIGFSLGIIFGLVLGLLVAWPFMWIWNYAVVGSLTVATPVNYWMAYWAMIFFNLFIRGPQSYQSSK